MIVLDTNVLSESLRPEPSERVGRWVAAQSPQDMFITTITIAEMLYGLEITPAGKRRARWEAAIERIISLGFDGRVLPFDTASARIYAGLSAAREKIGRPMSQSDAMIAAISRSRNAAIATRNTKDFEHCGVKLINPWTA
jgi:predicted nucleic acid-binding protein